MYRFLILLLVIWGLSGCESRTQKPLKIAANQWVGYTPLFYANEMGWLEEDGFTLKFVSALSESLNLFHTRSVDIMTSTQYEYMQARRENDHVVPVILFDRSNGGDMILSNTTLDVIKHAPKIDVYLEQESINTVLLNDFIRKYHIPHERLQVHETNPFDLKSFMPTKEPMLIVTYAPYDVKLLAHGFHVIDSTRTMQTLLVVDFLCADSTLVAQEQKRFKKLKAHIDRAIEVSQTDPKHYFDVVVPYLQEKDFHHFKEELSAIEWINHPTSMLLKKLQEHHIETGSVVP